MKRKQARTREITKTEWNDFCDEFSRQHQGWLTNVEIDGAIKVKESPFQKLGLARDGRQTKISIMIDGKTRKPLKHVVDGATHLWVEQDKGGNDQGLQIEAKGGAKTIVRFINSPHSR